MKSILTLFAGGGLADVGARAAGYEPVGAVEWDPAVAEVYARNHGDHVTVAPVEEVDYCPYAGVDAVWASPCCTNASVANSEGEEAPEDRSAAEAIVRCLQECRPERVVLENVWGYRNFQSFGLILRGLWDLGYRFDFEHVNAADYGVPQTRKRLILRAWLRKENLPMLYPTHCEGGRGGGLFDGELLLLPWRGWYAAVEDLLPSCPESRLAEWQLKRLPERLETLLVEGTGHWPAPECDRGPSDHVIRLTARGAVEPAPAIRPSSGLPRAVLVQGTSTLDVRDGRAPSAAVMATVSAKAAMPRAVLVQESSTLDAREAAGSAASVVASPRSASARAILIDAINRTGAPLTVRDADEPAFTLTQNILRRPSTDPRAILEGCRVVQLTPRCLARFQSVPDWYWLPEKRGLACRVIGNGVPCDLAAAVLRSFER